MGDTTEWRRVQESLRNRVSLFRGGARLGRRPRALNRIEDFVADNVGDESKCPQGASQDKNWHRTGLEPPATSGVSRRDSASNEETLQAPLSDKCSGQALTQLSEVVPLRTLKKTAERGTEICIGARDGLRIVETIERLR